jgi:curli production assembly/transport component CsgG/holdfast attachment protein HfaB
MLAQSLASRLVRGLTPLAVTGFLLSGCASTTASPQTGLYAQPMGNAPVTRNDTPYSASLICLADFARRYHVTPPRIAVGRIADMTGAASQVTGAQLTQGASMFAMTAVGKSGGRLVERYDTIVPEIELKYANGRLLSDTPEKAGKDANNFRRVFAGQIAGSSYYIVGGITELNANIRSDGGEAYPGRAASQGAKGLLTRQVYVMNVAMDLRLVDSKSQEVVDMVSYQKQIVGRQVRAGVFDFFNGNIIDVSAGTSGMEPAHLAVRSLVERAVFEFTADLYGLQDHRYCLRPELDPLGSPSAGN